MMNHGTFATPDGMDMKARSLSAASSSQAVVSPSGGEEKERPRLTDSEKKANHIASEQKRRQAIREGFDRLSDLVPGLQGQARSEGIVLHVTLRHFRKLMKERRTMIEDLEANGCHVDPAMKKPLESLPPGWLDDDSEDAESDSESSEESDEEEGEGEGDEEDEEAEQSSGSREGSNGNQHAG